MRYIIYATFPFSRNMFGFKLSLLRSCLRPFHFYDSFLAKRTSDFYPVIRQGINFHAVF